MGRYSIAVLFYHIERESVKREFAASLLRNVLPEYNFSDLHKSALISQGVLCYNWFKKYEFVEVFYV